MAKKGKLVRSASSKAQFKAYKMEGRHEKNKINRSIKTAEEQPNNTQLPINNIKYKRNRKSFGHICKGLYKSLGFKNNEPNEFMLKGKAPVHLYYAGETIFCFNSVVPNTGKSMGEQLEELGFKYLGPRYGKRKYKKTSR